MRGLFRSFEAEGVEFLLIGGQAAVLYGAAYFTQDLDLWVRPTPANFRACLRALARVDALVHKLTPPFSVSWARRGHGFHFLIPQRGQAPVYLDLMGRPPRAASFPACRRRACRVRTPWGLLPVVAIEDLVEMKKTNRPGDYEVIARLVRIRLARTPSPGAEMLRWAGRNAFRVEDLAALVEVYRSRELACPPRVLAQRFARHLEAGRAYWLPRIEELRRLRSTGRLLPEGLSVRSLVRHYR